MRTTNTSISRRNFIASLGLAAGALGVAGLSSKNAYAAEAETAAESTINPDDVNTVVLILIYLLLVLVAQASHALYKLV